MNKQIISSIIIILLFFAAFVSINNPQLNNIALYVAIPIALVLSVVQYRFSFAHNRYVRWLLVLYCWIGITFFGASNQLVAQAQMKSIMGVIILLIIVANVSKNPKAIPWLYLVFVCLFITAVNYARTNLLNDVRNGARATDDVLNANTLAYYTFYFSCAIYVLGDCPQNGNLKKILRYMFFGVIFISVWVALITASRQVLVIQGPLFLIFLIMRYGMGRHKKLFYIIGGGILFVLLSSGIVDSVFEGSLLQERYELKLENDQRIRVLEEAIEVGNNHPFFGVGPGNFVVYSRERVFSHCTYTELYANSGFPAILIYVLIIINFISRQFKRYRRNKDTMYLFFMIFGVFFAIDNFFYVFYAKLWLMSFFVLVACHSETYYRLQQQDRTLIMEKS